MTDLRAVRQTRRKIDRLEAQLAELYAERKEMIIEMSADMTRREIAEQWGISNPRVSNIINEGGVWREPEPPPDACPVSFCGASGDEPCVSSNGRLRSDHGGRRDPARRRTNGQA